MSKEEMLCWFVSAFAIVVVYFQAKSTIRNAKNYLEDCTIGPIIDCITGSVVPRLDRIIELLEERKHEKIFWQEQSAALMEQLRFASILTRLKWLLTGVELHLKKEKTECK